MSTPLLRSDTGGVGLNGSSPGAFRPPVRRSQSTGASEAPRAFRSLAHSVFGIGRFQAAADEGLSRNIDVQGLVQRLALTLASPETYKKVASNVFYKFAMDVRQPDGSVKREMPTSRLPDVYAHWQIPEDHVGIFWAMLRKQPGHFDKPLPSTISSEDFQAVLVRVLRRVRDKYCERKVSKGQFVQENSRRLEEEYSLSDSCGKGSFGECFFVTHRTSKKKRVVKKLSKDGAQVPTEEVAIELNTLKRLDHPNIVRVFEWFESPDAYLLVLEAAQGGDLKKLLTSVANGTYGETKHEGGKDVPIKRPGLDEDFVCNMAQQSLRALIYIHSQHIIHRDIKPANMLLATEDLEKPRLLLADFGVAELFEEQGRMSSLVKGTVSYMAPEVFMNILTTKSDVWALGVVVFELLTAEKPFKGDNPMAMYAKLKTSEAKYGPVEEAGCSEHAVKFLKRCLTKDESKRPSAAEVIADPWLSDKLRVSLPQGRHAKKVRRGLQGFMTNSYFTRAAMNCIAAQLDTSRIEGLTEIFQAMDADQNGLLSPAEIAAGLAELGVDPDSIGQMVDALDVNNDGVIQYSELVASLLKTQGQLIEEVLYHAFYIFDVNHDGMISLDELRSILSGEGPLAAVLPDGKTVEQVLQEVDTSHDGSISFAEFKAYLLREGESKETHPEATGREVASDEVLHTTLRRIAPLVGRAEEDLIAQAKYLSEKHWINTVGDLRQLQDADWPRLGLPLKLERTLRTHITGS